MTTQTTPSQKITNTHLRLPTIIDYIAQGLNQQQIANKLNLTRETISRDLAQLPESPTWKAYLYNRWIESDNRLRNSNNPEDYREAHRSLTRLLQRSGIEVNLTKVELTKTEIEVNVLLKDYEGLIAQATKPKLLAAANGGTPTQQGQQ